MNAKAVALRYLLALALYAGLIAAAVAEDDPVAMLKDSVVIPCSILTSGHMQDLLDRSATDVRRTRSAALAQLVEAVDTIVMRCREKKR